MKTNEQLIRVMQVQSVTYKTERMQRFIKKELAKMNLQSTADKYGNLYVTKGNADLYPTMVCHIDTVHDINNNVEIVQIDDKLLAIDRVTLKRYGIGGDDKVGIYITLQMLKQFTNFKAVFFLDEENGCIGSSQADFNYFNDSTIVLECDRRGITDFVTSISGTTLSNDELQNDISHILKKYDRKCVSGGITDVGEIAENNTVQVANMSCGYYDPHSDNEYIIIPEVEATKQMCYEILKKTMHKRYEMPLENRISYSRPNYQWSYQYDEYDYYDSSYYQTTNKEHYSNNFKTTCACPSCGQEDVWFEDIYDALFCMNCHEYVEADLSQVMPDDEFMDKSTDEYLLNMDDELYNAMFDSTKPFKKNVEPKYLKNGN